MPCFGFVNGCSVRPRSQGASEPYAAMLEKAAVPEKRRRWTHSLALTVLVNKKVFATRGELITEKPVILEAVSRVSHTLRLFRAVDDAREAPLFRYSTF